MFNIKYVITCVMLCYITYVMFNRRYVMIYNIKYVITCVMLCYITFDMLCYVI